MFARSPWSGLVSIWLGTDHGIESATTRNVVLLIVAFIEVRYIGLYFMDLSGSERTPQRLPASAPRLLTGRPHSIYTVTAY